MYRPAFKLPEAKLRQSARYAEMIGDVGYAVALAFVALYEFLYVAHHRSCGHRRLGGGSLGDSHWRNEDRFVGAAVPGDHVLDFDRGSHAHHGVAGYDARDGRIRVRNEKFVVVGAYDGDLFGNVRLYGVGCGENLYGAFIAGCVDGRRLRQLAEQSLQHGGIAARFGGRGFERKFGA